MKGDNTRNKKSFWSGKYLFAHTHTHTHTHIHIHTHTNTHTHWEAIKCRTHMMMADVLLY